MERDFGITFQVYTSGRGGGGLGSSPRKFKYFCLFYLSLEEQANRYDFWERARLPCPIVTVQEKTVPILTLYKQFYILIKDYYKFTNVLFVH